MLSGHDSAHGTSFAANYPGVEVPGERPQNTRLGHESVICQRCHADNVIAAVKSATHNGGEVIKPITEAIHNNHRGISSGGPIAFADALGRDGGCQGCHPAHRSDGDMDGYPITLAGTNRYATGDNRGASGGCFVGRDVHSNPGKDSDGAETPEHLNAVGQWLADNVSNSPSENTGIWCTNCHNQLGQEMWKAENMESLVHGVGLNDVRGQPTLAALAAAVGTTEEQAISWLDPKDSNPTDDTYDVWDTDPGLCNYVAGYFGVIPVDPAHDGNVATVEVNVNDAASCSTGGGTGLIDCGAEFPGAPAFHICGSTDGDGDFSVSLLDFCTTDDCVTDAQATLPAGSVAVPVPMSAATDGRDHWLAPGEPHCADCHAAPYVEQSGNINAFPPFNYPRKASLMRYSRGHQDISCQGCHESIHGLYPVTPNIDTTSYAQAAALNHDGSHGPLKCGTCHDVGANGIPTWMQGVQYNGKRIRNYDDAVSWAHTFTAEVSPLEPGGVCQNCHGDRANKILEDSGKWLRHSFVGRIGRLLQDKAEIDALGDVAGGGFVDDDNLNGLTSTVCTACHSLQGGPNGGFVNLATCDNTTWKSHNIDGRLSEKVWEYVSKEINSGSTCGW
jgi:mono/diheme cytochrome c family protein